MLKSLNDPSLWLRHVIANWPNRSRKSFLARKLNDRKSATNSTKFNCVSYMIDVVRAFTCQVVSEPPGIPGMPLRGYPYSVFSFSLATHNKLRARYCKLVRGKKTIYLLIFLARFVILVFNYFAKHVATEKSTSFLSDLIKFFV